VTERKVQLETGLSADGVRQGAEQVKQVVGDMARDVQAKSDAAAKGVDGIGDGAQGAAAKLDRATTSIVSSIQRATAASQAGQRGTAEYFESLARQRNVSSDVLRPYLDQLRLAQQGQQVATAGIDNMGMSARATAAALRQVPAQVTDIVTSLQGGQAPLTVLLQQGGQLRDVFGSTGGAVRALGGYLVGMVTPLTLALGAVGALTAGYVLGGKEATDYTRGLVLTGNAAGTTAGQLGQMAAQVEQLSGATQGRAAEVLVSLVETGRVGAANLVRFAAAAIELERVGGPAAEKTAAAFADLAKKPLEAALKLNEAQNFLTASTYQQIKSLQDQGRATDAAALAQDAYANAIQQRAPQITNSLGFVERAWLSIKDATKAAGDALLSVGRGGGDPLGLQIQQLEQQIAANNAERSGAGAFGQAAIDKGNAKLQARLTLLQQAAGYQALGVAYQAQQAQQVQALVEWDRQGTQVLSSRAKLEQEIQQARAQGLAAGKSEADIQERIAAIKAKAAGSAPATAATRDLEQQARLLAELQGLSGSYAADVDRLNAARARGVVTEEQYATLMRELVSRQPFARAAAQDLARAAEAEARAVKQATDDRERYLQTLDRGLQQGQAANQALQDELLALTAGRDMLRQRIALRLEEAALDLERRAAAIDSAQADSAESARLRARAQQLREEAALRQRLVQATASQEVQAANKRAAEQAGAEWMRWIDGISYGLADALLRGGREAADYLKDLFRNLVLRPAVQAVVQPLVGSFGAMLGGSAAASTGAANSPLSLLQAISGFGSSASAGSQLAMAGATKTALETAFTLIKSGQVASGLGVAAGVAGAYGGAYMLGRSAGQIISNGYAVGGGSGNSAINLGAAIGTIWGPIGTAVGAAIGGLVNRTFGRKLQDIGIEGSFAADGTFAGQQYTDLKGGLLRSDKTQTAPLDAQLAGVLTAGSAAAVAQVKAYADALGLPVQAVEGYTQAIRVSFKDLSPEQIEERIAETVQAFGAGLAKNYSAELRAFSRGAETELETLQRLASLQTFSEAVNSLGGVFTRVAGLSFDAREALFAMAGGVEAFSQQALSFVQQYYTRDEVAGVKARDLQGTLTSIGIAQPVNSREDFRAVVEGLDVGTDQGRQQLATLLGVASDFAQVADYLAETGRTLAQAADQAPQNAVLATLLQQEQPVQREQVDAIHAVRGVLEELVELVRDSSGALRPVLYPGEYVEVSMGA
jgi:phage-related minor tail protein